MVTIRKAQESDFESIWEVFHQIVVRGDTPLYDPDTTKD